MLTLADFVNQLTQIGSPQARIVFKLGKDELELDRISAVGDIKVSFIGAESFTAKLADLEHDNASMEKELEDQDFKIKTLMESARLHKWHAEKILQELEGV